MPVRIKKVKGGYRVSTPHGVKAKKTTEKKAKAQERLLNAIDHGFVPSRNRMTISNHKTIMGQGKKKKKK